MSSCFFSPMKGLERVEFSWGFFSPQYLYSAWHRAQWVMSKAWTVGLSWWTQALGLMTVLLAGHPKHGWHQQNCISYDGCFLITSIHLLWTPLFVRICSSGFVAGHPELHSHSLNTSDSEIGGFSNPNIHYSASSICWGHEHKSSKKYPQIPSLQAGTEEETQQAAVELLEVVPFLAVGKPSSSEAPKGLKVSLRCLRHMMIQSIPI